MTLDQIISQQVDKTNQIILKMISFIDLTSLESTDSRTTIDWLVDKANEGVDGTFPAAVCVYPNLGDYLRNTLRSEINAAVVGGAFPTGQTFTQAKLEEIRLIAQTKVDEVDIVINRGDLLCGKYEQVHDEIASIKMLIGNKHLKVILETGELEMQEHVQKASEIAIEAGADFIKTSTGKMVRGADPESVYTMSRVIKRHFEATGKKVGIKPSGGIRTYDDALLYYRIIDNILGEEWLSPELFRIGASSLYDNLKEELNA